jgi:hypothetical protein
VTTITATPDALAGAVDLAIAHTETVTRILRTDANGTEEVRTSTGQLPAGITGQVLRRNRVLNSIFETSLTGWVSIDGALTRPTTGGLYGSAVARVTTTTAGAYKYLLTGTNAPVPVTAGATDAFGIWIRPSVAVAGVTLQLTYSGPGGTKVIPVTDYTPCPANVWTRLSMVRAPSAGYTTAWFAVITDGVQSIPAGTVFDFDGADIEASDVPRDHFDGNTPDGGGVLYAWEGTAYASASVQMLEPGQIILTDYEAAHGLNTYNVYHADGTFATATATLVLDGPWLSLPVMPQYSARVESITGYGSTRESQSIVHKVIGRADPLVAIGVLGTRTGSLVLWCESLAQARAFERVFDRGEVMQLRQRVEGLDMYFTVTGLPLAPYEARGETATRWALTVEYVQVLRPVGPLAGDIGWTWEALAEAFPSWDAVDTAYASWDALTLDERS